MRKSTRTGSAAARRASRVVRGSASPEACSAASRPKRAIKCPVHADKFNRPVQLSIFEYAAEIGVTLLPEAS